MPKIRLAIVGSRGFQDYDFLKQCIDQLAANNEIIEIVSGEARGADTLGERYARENGIPTKIFRPDWDKFGKSAGFRRNITIVNNADVVAAFWDGRSRGTANTIDLTKKANKTLFIFNY